MISVSSSVHQFSLVFLLFFLVPRDSVASFCNFSFSSSYIFSGLPIMSSPNCCASLLLQRRLVDSFFRLSGLQILALTVFPSCLPSTVCYILFLYVKFNQQMVFRSSPHFHDKWSYIYVLLASCNLKFFGSMCIC